ncbi:hypothetical protein H6503_06630, partial [Candidatus Woesearchaeota archaeon]|nr:hypothetical protein [Candidatus Woesearchaeota archaeon]
KTALEAPKVYHYMKNAKDLNGVYGLAVYGLRKAFGLAIPIAGPMVEGGSLKDMIATRITYEAKRGFLKEIGAYESLYDRIKSRVEEIAGKIRPAPAYQPNFQPA